MSFGLVRCERCPARWDELFEFAIPGYNKALGVTGGRAGSDHLFAEPVGNALSSHDLLLHRLIEGELHLNIKRAQSFLSSLPPLQRQLQKARCSLSPCKTQANDMQCNSDN